MLVNGLSPLTSCCQVDCFREGFSLSGSRKEGTIIIQETEVCWKEGNILDSGGGVLEEEIVFAPEDKTLCCLDFLGQL